MSNMKITNLVIAIIYTVLYGMLILVALDDFDVEMLIGTILLSGPVIVNWLSYSKWPK